MLAAQLEIDLVAGIAQISKDMATFKRDVVGHMKEINDAAELAKKGLEAVGIGLSVGFAVEFLRSVNDATAHMKDFATVAGTTAEAISRFELPARVAGSSVDAVSQAIFRMGRASVEANDPMSKSAQALHSIGLSTADFKNLKPDEIFELVARRVATYGDSLEKNAVMQVLFNRSGAEMNKVVKEIAESGQLQATVTNEQADKAQALNKAMIELKMSSEAAWRSMVAQGVPALTQIIQKFTEAKEAGGIFQGIVEGLATAFEKLNGDTLADQLGRINQSISLERANIDGMTNGWRSMVTTDNERAAATAHLNQLLAQRENIERAIFGAELDAQNRRALAGMEPGKGPPKYDPNAGAAAALFQQEMAQLDQEEAKLRGVGELEAYITKLGTERYRLLSPEERDELVRKEKIIVDLRNEIQARQLILASGTAWLQAMQKMKDVEQAAVDASRDQVEQARFDLSLLGLSVEEQEKLNALHAIDLELKKQIQQIDVEDGDFQSAAQIAEAQRLRDIADQRKAVIGGLLDQKKAISDQLTLWNSVADAAGSFFSQLITSGKNAFDVIRNTAKQFLAELISIFAKRWVLQLVAGVTGSGAIAAQAGQVGQGTVGGAIVDYFTGSGVSSYNTSTGQYYQPGGAQDFQGTGYAPTMTAGQYATGAVGGAFMGYGIGSTANTLIGNSRNQAGMQAGGAVGGAAGYIAGAYLGAEYGSAFGPIGMVVGAIIGALIGSLIKSGGGPKQQAAFAGTYDASGHLVATPNGQALTDITGDNQQVAVAHGLTDASAMGYANAMHTLGLTGGNMTFGLGLSQDQQGTAPGFIHGIVQNAKGETVFKQFDDNAPRDADQFQTQTQLEVSRMILAAVKSSDMPQYLANVFKGVDAMTATQEEINAIFQTAAALKSIYDLTSRDPLTDAAQAFTDSMDQFDAALRNNGLSVRAVMDAYDGSAAAATNLQQATVAYYNAQVQLLNQITAAKQSIDGMFGDTFRGFKLAGMTDQQKYDFYQKEAKDLEAKALTSTDPAEIQRLVQQITQDEQSAFALLTPEQQAGLEGQSFITQGTAAQEAIDSHLDHIKDAVATATKDTLSEIKDLIAGPNNSMNSAANTMNGAANTIADSADKPLHVIVDNYGGSQEVTG